MSQLADVTLTIHRVEKLIGLNPGGTSNPYITATIASQSVMTPVVHKSLNPEYETTFTFAGCWLPTIVTFEVFNKLPFADVEDTLGKATVTIFGIGETLGKSVTLSHGGNGALAQRAPLGCGTLFFSYTTRVTEAVAPDPTPQPPSASLTSVPPTAATPLVVPPAPHITGAVVAKPAVVGSSASVASSSQSSDGRRSPVRDGSFLAVNASAVNPAAISPKVVPAQSQPGLLPVSLTPPTLTAVKVPETLGMSLVPQCAPGPPPIVGPSPMTSTGSMQYVSYPVPGLAAPSGAAPSQSVSQYGIVTSNPAPVPPTATEMLYANNNSSASTTAVPPVTVAAPVTHLEATGPAASSLLLPQMSLPAPSLHSANNLARSPLVSPQSTPSSSLYQTVAVAPVLASQALLVTPPHIEGTYIPASSQVPSASPSPPTLSSLQFASPQPLLHPTSASTSAVAVAPRPAPLSASTTTSRVTTPSSAMTPGRDPKHAHGLFPATRVLPVPSASGTPPKQPPPERSVKPRRMRPATADPLVKADAAALHTRPRSGSPDAAAVNIGLLPRRSRSARQEAGTKASAPKGAAALYADPEYLFAMAASGHDLHIFQQLRVVDPQLTAGFADCVDYAGRSLLHTAAWHGQLAVLQILLAPTPAVPLLDLRGYVTRQSGNTILHAAACGGQMAVTQWLRYVHPTAGMLLLEVRNARGMMASECAQEAGFPSVARMLLPTS